MSYEQAMSCLHYGFFDCWPRSANCTARSGIEDAPSKPLRRSKDTWWSVDFGRRVPTDSEHMFELANSKLGQRTHPGGVPGGCCLRARADAPTGPGDTSACDE